MKFCVFCRYITWPWTTTILMRRDNLRIQFSEDWNTPPTLAIGSDKCYNELRYKFN